MATDTQLGTITHISELKAITCGSCGGGYAIAEKVFDEAHEHRKQGWRCPYCHSHRGFSYLLKQDANEVARAKRLQYEAEERMHQAQESAQRAEHRRRAEKAAKTRLKNRVAAGVCPCCNRSFANLARHMKGQHPDYTK